ncbi:hypothetical protein pf16_121 [Pseudomonas phage pf16]|uniref:Uncharacterized protein n=1 Tax=Pseudomonas phage pf16 TaxID=1815630 RepID=A0A1S5R401_9CAUD|nr:hypothetical protein FDG98_gp177 [Pseudomonas phage pf16]AND75044.1 hypothetical protein pf16_121 [Pseudomonas phage pf16]
MINELTVADTFSEWMDKLNDLIDSHNNDSQAVNEQLPYIRAFSYDTKLSSGLVVRINGGKVRSGSLVETIADQSITLPANSVRVLAIYKVQGVVPTLQLYATNAVPERYVIPIGIFTTNGTVVTAYTDLRTQFTTSAGDATAASGIMQFDKLIDTNIVVPSNKNALSISPTVAEGVTVEVSDGSIWVVL